MGADYLYVSLNEMVLNKIVYDGKPRGMGAVVGNQLNNLFHDFFNPVQPLQWLFLSKYKYLLKQFSLATCPSELYFSQYTTELVNYIFKLKMYIMYQFSTSYQYIGSTENTYDMIKVEVV